MFTTATPASVTTTTNTPVVTGQQQNDVAVSLARSQAELIDAFRLLYQSYLRAGLAEEDPTEIRLTPFHLLPSTEVFVAKCRAEVISTMTMTADADLGLPMDSMYRKEVDELRGTGQRFAEMGCFADRRESPRRFLQVFQMLAQLVLQVARSRQFDGLVAATHPRHARFYMRSFGFEQFGDLKSCPYAEGNPAVALVLPFEKHRETKFGKKIFANPFGPDKLVPTRWDTVTSERMSDILQAQQRRQNQPGVPSVEQRHLANGSS